MYKGNCQVTDSWEGPSPWAKWRIPMQLIYSLRGKGVHFGWKAKGRERQLHAGEESKRVLEHFFSSLSFPFVIWWLSSNERTLNLTVYISAIQSRMSEMSFRSQDGGRNERERRCYPQSCLLTERHTMTLVIMSLIHCSSNGRFIHKWSFV